MKLRIDHIAVWTADLERLASFYTTHFGATASDLYINPRRGFRSYFVSFARGPRLEIMTIDSLAGDAPPCPCPGYAHFALSVGSEANVDAFTEQLREAGVPVVDGPRRTGDGCYESTVLDPDGNRIEITV